MAQIEHKVDGPEKKGEEKKLKKIFVSGKNVTLSWLGLKQ
jgi:hypothetical protein